MAWNRRLTTRSYLVPGLGLVSRISVACRRYKPHLRQASSVTTLATSAGERGEAS